MILEHMIEFVVLAEDGNFHRAADKLFISQSALSKHIKGLEQDLGIPLLERNSSGVLLNDFGKIFYPYAKQIAQLNTKYNQDVKQKLHSLTGIINIGTEYEISGLIRAFKRENPDFVVNLFSAPSFRRMRLGLRQGEFEIAFMLSNNEFGNEFNSLPAFTDEVVLAISSRDTLAQLGESVNLAELRKRHFILPAEDTMFAHQIDYAFHAAGITPVAVCSGVSTSLTMDMVAEEIGVALLPRREAEYHCNDNVTLLSLNPVQEMKIDLFFRKHAEFSPGAAFFISFLQKYNQTKK